MTFLEQQTRTYDGLRDAAREFIVTAEVKAWLNEAQRDLAQRLSVLRKELADTVPASGTIPLPADLVEITNLRFGDTDVFWRDDRDFYDARDDLVSDPYGGPYGRVFDGNIEVTPAQAEGNDYTLRYIYEPEDLVADADISPLPIELHIKMVYYARSMGFMRLNESDQAGNFMDLYERQLPPPPVGQSRINPGPLDITYERGPFDLVNDSVHRG